MESRLLRTSFLVLSLALASVPSFAQQFSPQALITQPISESQLTTLRGNTHPLAQPQFDIGIAAPNLPLQRMLLVLKRSPQQDFALRKLLDDQQDKASANYHKWLTPDEFGLQFGPSDQDVQQVTGWQQSHGFQVNRVAHGRSVIEFSGVEAQVEAALHTQIHKYLVNGEEHWANASDPQIPAALAPAVAGVLSLHNFPRHSMAHFLGTYFPATRRLTPANPLFTLLGRGCDQDGNCYAVGPADFGAIYNVQTLWNSGIDGTGQTIAIVGESDINLQDDRDFRSLFGLPAKDPVVIYDGPNPGLQPDEGEADIDVQWSGAIAPNATIDFVASQSTETTAGVDLSAVYIIDNNLAPVMSESYGFCELGIGTSGNQFYNSLWAQAAAQGITAILAAGDQGSAGCDFRPQAAQFGLAVSGFASTPFNVAVGGTDFNDVLNPQQYWNLTNNSATQESVKGYIPETTWNLSCTNSILLGDFGWGTNAENNCNNSQLLSQAPFLLYPIGGSGGVSSCTVINGQTGSCSGGYSKPSWQTAPGVPADGKRDLPDISLFASNGVMGNFYIFCESDAQANCSFGSYGAAGGTSFGAPAFAGIMALVNQQMKAFQGNANYVMYKLAGQQTASSCNSSTGPGANCVFNDITSGTIAMPCLAGSPNCVVNTAGHQYGVLSGYTTGTGYDLATGLGSINVANLVNKWNTVTFRPTTTNLTLSPTINITHGQSVTVTANVAPSSGSGTPTGGLSLLTSTGVNAGGFTLANGALSSTTNLLPGGGYSVTAHYAGDSTFGGSDSPAVNVTVGKENSSPQIELVTFDWQGNPISPNATTAIYGSPYLLRVDVFNSAGSPCEVNNQLQSGCPTGNVTLTDNSSPLDGGTFGLNSLGYTEDQIVQFPGGNNSVKAQYAGDGSFNASSATKAYNITPATTTITAVPNCCYAAGVLMQTQVTIQAQSFGAAPGGTVAFFVNGTAVPGTVSYSGVPGSPSSPTATLTAFLFSSSSPFPTPGTYNLTAAYGGDGNYSSASSVATSVPVKFPTPFVVPNIAPTGILQSGTTVNLTIDAGLVSKTIAPTGTITVTNTNGTVPVASYNTVTDSNGFQNLRATLAPFAANFNDNYLAQYNGDSNYPVAFGGPVFVYVNGTDFTLLANQRSISTTQGGRATQTLFVGTQNGAATVNFGTGACGGLPAESSCQFAQNQIGYSNQVQLTIATTAPHFAATMTTPSLGRGFMFAMAMPFVAILLIGTPRQRTLRALSMALASGLLMFILSCGGGSTGPPPPPADPGTPRGSYPITVTATSGTGSTAITHTTTFTLVVQ